MAKGAISGDAEVKAEALEAIESLEDRVLARRLVALLEGKDEAVTLYRLQALQDLAADHQHWLRALAARAIYEELEHDLESAAETVATDESPVVRTAIPQHTPSQRTATERMSVVEMVLALQQASIFENLDPEELEALASVCEERVFGPEELVYAQDSAADELTLIVAGRAVARVEVENGYRSLAEYGPGEPIGELGVLRHAKRVSDVVAGPDGMHAIVIAGDDFLGLLSEQPAMATALLATLAERLARTVDPTGAGGIAPSL